MVHLSTTVCAACLLGTVSIPMWLRIPDQSSVGADFATLEQNLKDGDWEAAAEETQDLIFKISQKNDYPTIGQDLLTSQSVQNFPCKDIKSLDHLWRKHSQDRFGYRSQLLAIKHRAFELNYDQLSQAPEVWAQFSDQMGWQQWQARRSESARVKQAIDVPVGVFPLPVRSTGDFGDAAVLKGEPAVFGMSFLERARQCGIEK